MSGSEVEFPLVEIAGSQTTEHNVPDVQQAVYYAVHDDWDDFTRAADGRSPAAQFYDVRGRRWRIDGAVSAALVAEADVEATCRALRTMVTDVNGIVAEDNAAARAEYANLFSGTELGLGDAPAMPLLELPDTDDLPTLISVLRDWPPGSAQPQPAGPPGSPLPSGPSGGEWPNEHLWEQLKAVWRKVRH